MPPPVGGRPAIELRAGMTREEGRAMNVPMEPGDVDARAWQELCDLVRRGAGVSDWVLPDGDDAPPPSAAEYAYLTGLVDHHRHNIIPFLVERCGIAGKSVLDFGSGTGALSMAMIQAGAAAVTGVEPNLLNFQASIWRKRAHRADDRAHFHHVPDTSRLPFLDDTFDACVCNSVLQCVPDRRLRRRLLVEMHRVVKPGGLVVLCGSGNGLFPWGCHATRWWVNLAPDRAARLGYNRGVTYRELRRALAPLGATLVPPAGPEDRALTRWRQRVAARSTTAPRRAAYQAVFAAYALCEATLCRWLDTPIEAFTPYVELAFRKAPRP